MPTYQYACTECAHAFDQVQSFSDNTLTVCPACEGRLRKVFNAVGVVFKGSGFYRNDSRPTSTQSDAAASGGTAMPSSDSGSGSGSGSGSSSSPAKESTGGSSSSPSKDSSSSPSPTKSTPAAS